MSTNNDKVRAIAEKVIVDAGLYYTNTYGSLLLTLMVVSIILSAIRVLQECNGSKCNSLCFQEKCTLYGEQLRRLSRKKSWLTQARLKRIIRRELTNEEYKQCGSALLNSILNLGATLTDEEVQTLTEAANV